MIGFLFLLLLAGSIYRNSFKETDLTNMFELEQQLIQNLQKYAKELQTKLRIVKSALAEYKGHLKEAAQNPELYVSNPWHDFRVMRRLRQDWNNWQRKLQQLGTEELKTQQSLLALIPKESTLKKTVQRLQFLLKFYNYEPESLLQDNSRYLRLSSADCLYMAKDLFEQEKYHDAIEWLKLATENYTSSIHNDFIAEPQWQIYELKYQAYIRINRLDEAHVALSTAMELSPHNEQLLKHQEELELMAGRIPPAEPVAAPAVVLSGLQEQCGGESRQDNTLSCEVVSLEMPFLLLAPLRLEDLYYSPYVMRYPDGIYDREIREIKNAFYSCPPSHRFEENGDIFGCHIPESYSTLIRTLGERMLDMSALNDDLEGLFVLEYGATDAFKPFQLPHLNIINLEKAQATAILFLNDAVLGGALTIPNLDLVFHPQRGDALVTYNQGNFEHTLCPNVVGTSMVIIKFMFNTYIELEGDANEFVYY